MVRGDCGTSVVGASQRRGTQRGSTAAKREEGIVDGPSEWAFRLLPIPWEISSARKAIRARPATFATELGILAIQGFEDMNEQARDIMIKDKFIAGQKVCTASAIRRFCTRHSYRRDC